MHSTPTLQGSSASFHTIDLNVWVLFLGIPLCLLKSLSIKQQLEAFFEDEKKTRVSQLQRVQWLTQLQKNCSQQQCRSTNSCWCWLCPYMVFQHISKHDSYYLLLVNWSWVLSVLLTIHLTDSRKWGDSQYRSLAACLPYPTESQIHQRGQWDSEFWFKFKLLTICTQELLCQRPCWHCANKLPLDI